MTGVAGPETLWHNRSRRKMKIVARPQPRRHATKAARGRNGEMITLDEATHSLPPGSNKGKSKGAGKGMRRAATPTPPPVRQGPSTSAQSATQGYDPSSPQQTTGFGPGNQQSSYFRFTPGVCNWCARNHRANMHEWRDCPFHQEYFEQRNARMLSQGMTPPGFPQRNQYPPRNNAWSNGPPRMAPQMQATSSQPAKVTMVSTGDQTSPDNSQ